MLRFFRTIRKTLMEQNKVRKYIWYALGEILLVMIGILLALQVNNWNENRKKSELEIQTLIEIRTSMELAVDQLEISSQTFSTMEENLSGIIQHLKSSQSIPDSVTQNLIALFGYPTPKFNYSAYENLKNRGLDIISNEDLKLSILNIYEVEFYYLIEELDRGLQNFSNQTINLQLSYFNLDFTSLNEGFDASSIQIKITDYEKAMMDPSFFNYLYLAHGFRLLGTVRTELSKERVETVIEQIDEELKHLGS